MEFVNETDYDWRALRALNRAAIRLDRRWRSLLLRAMGVLCGLILLRGPGPPEEGRVSCMGCWGR